MTYCISDIHGCYDEFMELLERIQFSSNDTLYILGDAIDRGTDSIKCLQYIMSKPNIHMIIGNHEQMMMDALTNENNDYMYDWFGNGGNVTLKELCELSKKDRIEIMDYINGLPYLYEVKINEQKYVLVHAGLNVVGAASGKFNVTTANVLPKQHIEDIVWIRDEFYRNKALPKSITIFGHTPIPMIERQEAGKTWRDKRFHDKIGIDGACVYNGSLIALRLDDMMEFHVKKH